MFPKLVVQFTAIVTDALGDRSVKTFFVSVLFLCFTDSAFTTSAFPSPLQHKHMTSATTGHRLIAAYQPVELLLSFFFFFFAQHKLCTKTLQLLELKISKSMLFSQH